MYVYWYIKAKAQILLDLSTSTILICARLFTAIKGTLIDAYKK